MVMRPDWAMRSWIALNINEFRLFDMSGSPCRKVEILTTIKQLNNSNSSSNKVHRRLSEASFPDTKLAYRLISKNPSVNLPHHRPPAARPLGGKMTQGGGPRDPQVVSDSAGGGTGQPVKAVEGGEDITKGCCRPGTVRGLICFPLPSLEANG